MSHLLQKICLKHSTRFITYSNSEFSTKFERIRYLAKSQTSTRDFRKHTMNFSFTFLEFANTIFMTHKRGTWSILDVVKLVIGNPYSSHCIRIKLLISNQNNNIHIEKTFHKTNSKYLLPFRTNVHFENRSCLKQF